MVVASSKTAKAARRQGRRRLSSIDLLPEAADEDVLWAKAALSENDLSQVEILDGLNARLRAKGIVKQISKGSFSRYTIHAMVELRRKDDADRTAALWLARYPVNKADEASVAAREMIKYRVMQMLVDADGSDPKLLQAAALTLARISRAELLEAEDRRRADTHDRDAETREQVRIAAREAEDRAAAEALAGGAGPLGLTPETLEKINRLLTTGAA